MTPDEWFQSQYVFTGNERDVITLKEMWCIYCMATYSNMSWKDFKYFISRVKMNDKYVFHPVKYVNGKQRCNILWKVQKIG